MAETAELLMEILAERPGDQAQKHYAALAQGVVVRYSPERDVYALRRYDLSGPEPVVLWQNLLPRDLFVLYIEGMDEMEDKALSDGLEAILRGE